MSAPGGNQTPVNQLFGRTPSRPASWGGPNLRWGSTDPGVNQGYADAAMPGTPSLYRTAFSGAAGTPFASNPMQYGRWNWAGGGAGGGQQPAPGGGGYYPPTPTPTPTPQPPGGGWDGQPNTPGDPWISNPNQPTPTPTPPPQGVGAAPADNGIGSPAWWAAVMGQQKGG